MSAYVWMEFIPHGKAYPNNHVYQALVTVNPLVPAWNHYLSKDVALEFQRSVAGETFDQLVQEFAELGGVFADRTALYHELPPMSGHYKYVQGQSYALAIIHPYKSGIFIPNSHYGFLFGIWVRIKFQSNTDYVIEDAHIINCLPRP